LLTFHPVLKVGLSMKILGLILVGLLTQISMAQAPVASDPDAPSSVATLRSDNVDKAKTMLTIPAGTSIPLWLKQAISTKTARDGDPVYAETAFPFVVNEKVVIPAGTYIQGRIERVQRGGHVKGRAEVLIHFTSMIYPNGYTVMLGGSVENTPGAEKTSMKDSEGTIRQDSEAGRKAETAAGAATTGAAIGGITNGLKGAGIGAGIGGAAGLAIGMLSRGADVRLEPGTSIQMEIQREVTVDASRVSSGDVAKRNQ
jgi:type IV secretion system protein VirB10